MADIVKKSKSVQALLKGICDFTSESRILQGRQEKSGSDFFSILFQVAFLFDTTGSMYPYFEQGKERIVEIIHEVIKRHKNTEVCYVAYKNHGDEKKFFDGKNAFYAIPFISDPRQIQREMEKIKNGGGGDGLTALECVLHYFAEKIIWQPQAAKIIVLIGDMPPHGVLDSAAGCPHERNYKEEIGQLKLKGVKIYSVFCFEEGEIATQRKQKVKEFFKWIAGYTGGKYLELSEINELVDLMVGICMKETGHLDEFLRDLERVRGLPASRSKTLLALKQG